MSVSTENDETIITDERGGRVFHCVHTEFGEQCAFLTPRQARLVAYDLLSSAEEAEGRS